MRELLTDKKISNMRPPETGRRQVFDDLKTGLCFRLTANGARSWSLVYRFNGKFRRDTIGPYPQIGLARARQIAGERLELIGQGKDPRRLAADQEAAEAAIRANTVAAAVARFVKDYAARKRWAEITRVMVRVIEPRWRDRPIAEITRFDIRELLDEIAKHAPIQANRTLTVLSIFFKWACDEELVESDPTARVRKPTVEAPRERVLGDDELRAFWTGCDALGRPFGTILKLLALTAQRKSEIGDLRWDEINWRDKQIELPASRYKTNTAHVIPLAPAAFTILEELDVARKEREKASGQSEGFCFSTTGKTPVSGYSKAKAHLDEHMRRELAKAAPDPKKFQLKPWIIHDLRRTARTNFSRIGVAADIGERVLGHAVPGLRGVYDRHSFVPEMRECLERWEGRLLSIINPPPANVTPMKRRAET
jgi:integrase